jgi:hypothetical protein
VILTDGRAHTPLADLMNPKANPSDIGKATRWYDTIGFNDTSWLEIGGYLHSENMHVIERLHRGRLLTTK